MKKLKKISDGDKFQNINGDKFVVKLENGLYNLININTGAIMFEGLDYELMLKLLQYDDRIKKVKKYK